MSLVGPVVRVADDDVALDGDGNHGVHRPGQGDVDGRQQDRRLIAKCSSVGRIPHSHYWPSGVIRIGLPV